MHFSIFHLPLLVAWPVSTLSLGGGAPGGQKALSDGSVNANCFWSGTSPFCAGACGSGYSDCGTSGCGDGACCWTGYKKYCCLGSCASVLPFLEANPGHGKPQSPTTELHTAKGPYDDYCPPGQHILCPPQARNNEECECLDDKSTKVAKGPYDDYCPPGQHILCPPQAKNNEECECLDD